MAKTLDPRLILTGRDGRLYDDEGNFLAEVPSFQAVLNFNNTDYQPAGSLLQVAILVGYTVALTFMETHVKDSMLARLLEEVKAGRQPVFHFQGKVEGHNGSTGRYVFRYCVPDGNIDVVNVQPGAILERQWNWRVNEAPDLQAVLTA